MAFFVILDLSRYNVDMNIRSIQVFVGSVFLLVFISIFGAIIYVRVSAKPYIYNDLNKIEKSQAVIILGAGIKASGEPSGVLQDRVDKALEIYKEKKVDKILISGNNKKIVYPSDDEVTPVRDYLLSQDVPPEVIFTDHEGYDTYTSLYRAKHQFGIDKLIISTQQFHLSRAVFIARNLGIDAVGAVADQGRYEDKNYVREYLAQPKAVFEILTGRVVDVVEESLRIKIGEDGQETWE